MPQETRLTLAHLQRIEKYTDALVQAADDHLSPQRMTTLPQAMKLNQLSNFLGVASESGSSPRAVANWVEYQMGRRETRRAWQESGLGKDILSQIRQMNQWAQTIVAEAQANATTTDNNPAQSAADTEWQQRLVHLKLIRLYAGYLRRTFVARGGQ